MSLTKASSTGVATGCYTTVDPHAVEQAVLNEVLWVMGLADHKRLGRLVTPILRPPVRRFARFAASFENDAARAGFCEASRIHIGDFVEHRDLTGDENIPAEGPMLVVSNHPGTYDLVMLAAAIKRVDLKIISSNVSFLRLFPATNEHFTYLASSGVVGDSFSRMATLRQSIRHLQAGGALFTFPSGRLDPDPALRPQAAREELKLWSTSLGLLLKIVPQVKVVPAMVSGVLSAGWYRSPVTWLRKEPHYKQKVAELFQVMQHFISPDPTRLSPQITFGLPFTLRELETNDDPAGITSEIVARTAALLEI